MACRNGRSLSKYLEGALPLRQRERLEQHLQSCLTCRRELAQLERLEQALRQAAPPPVPVELLALTMAEARRRLPLPVVRRSAAPVWAAACAVAAVLVLATALRLEPSGPGSPEARIAVASEAVAALPAAMVALPPPAVSRQAEAKVPAGVMRSVSRPVRMVSPVRETVRPAPAAPAPGAVKPAARALMAARRHADSGDPDLTVAALENVALTYPQSAEAAEALLAAAEMQRAQGNVAEADGAYRRVLTLPTTASLPQALAHKGLADLRRTSSGDDDMVRFHYAQARRALRVETARATAAGKTRALVALGDIERTTGRRDEAVADYATVANSSPAATDVVAALAEVL